LRQYLKVNIRKKHRSLIYARRNRVQQRSTQRIKRAQTRQATKKTQRRARSAARRKYGRIKTLRQTLKTAQKRQLRQRSAAFKGVVYLRTAQGRPSAFAELHYKTRKLPIGRLHGASLKGRRRKRKQFFRVNAKRNVNQRRR
jgi:hypothetical protein